MIINRKLKYTLFTKPTDRNTLLHFESFHPKHLKQSLPYSQFLRVLRNNSLEHLRGQQIHLMYEKFLLRGYPWLILDKALDRANSSFLTPPSTIQKKTDNRCLFPMQFNTASFDLASTIRNNWHTLELDPSLPEIFRQKPMMCYRQNKNLRDLLVKTDPRHCYRPVKKENINVG
ncbi:Hypothetical predicted protein, partial [Pelobates cultripes]